MAKAKFIGVYACNTWPSNVAASGRKYNWFVWEDGWGRYRAQLLDAAFQPLDNPRVVTAAEFQQHFKYQPHILVTPVTQLELGSLEEDTRKQLQDQEDARKVKQDIAELSAKLGVDFEPLPENSVKTSEPAQRPGQTVAEKIPAQAPELQVREPEPAVPAHTEPTPEEYEVAAKLDDESRTAFVLALTRWRRGDKSAAMDTFQNILKLEEGIVPAHKHMYTDFAIDLRKCALSTLAKEFYRRAVQLAPEDSNARFNLARIYFENGEIHNAIKELDEALKLEPDFSYALQFKDFLFTHYPKQARTAAPKKSDLANSKYKLFMK